MVQMPKKTRSRFREDLELEHQTGVCGQAAPKSQLPLNSDVCRRWEPLQTDAPPCR